MNVGYNLTRRYDDAAYLLVQNNLYVGPGGGFSPNHNAAAFNTIRTATTPDYVYDRLVIERLFWVPRDWQFVTRATGQLTTDRLLFSEMLGFGGYDSIRGYDQRTFNGDNGWFVNLELGPSPWEWGDCYCPKKLRVFGFFDVGEAFTLNAQPGEIESLNFRSVGVGARYSVDDRLSVRFDYGHAFTEVPGQVTRDRIHVGAVYLFGPGRP